MNDVILPMLALRLIGATTDDFNKKIIKEIDPIMPKFEPVY